MTNDKIYTLFAGVNGAGKSTFFNALINENDFGFRINLDEIIRDKFNNEWSNVSAQFSAGRIAVKSISDCIKAGTSFNQETTLTGVSVISNIKKAKAERFEIHLYYVGLDSAELSLHRVNLRKAKGGHGIPEEDIARRYSKSFENLKTILPLCDKVKLYDNSKTNDFSVMSPFLSVENGIIIKLDKEFPEYMKDIIEVYKKPVKLLSAPKVGMDASRKPTLEEARSRAMRKIDKGNNATLSDKFKPKRDNQGDDR